MTTVTTVRTLRGPALRRFARHYLEMIVAMIAGMALLGPVESLVLNPFGWADLIASTEVHALVMATNMNIAMVALMRWRGHGWAATAEMAGAMYASFVVFFPVLWLGALSATGLMVAGHVLMPFAMAAAMLWRLGEYTGHHRS
jgi:flagellar biosynthetic protein FliP